MSVSQPLERRFYTRKELSQLTSIAPSTLSVMARRGEGPPCFSPAGCALIRYPIDEAEAWMRGEGSSPRSPWGGERIKGEKKKKPGRRSKKAERAERARLDALCLAKQENVTSEGGAS